MTSSGIVLVLSAAVLHAVWNFLSKRAAGGVAFVWLFGVTSLIVWAPVVLIVVLVERPALNATDVLFIGGSAVLHLMYFLLLNWSYQIGDLSLVYPVARGTGPMLAAAGAVLLFEEKPTPLAVVGALTIGLSIFALAGNPRQWGREGSTRAVSYALLTGVAISCYTLWDKVSVSERGIMPLLITWISQYFRLALLVPYALRHRTVVRAEWKFHAPHVLGVAILSPLSYIMVLTALASNPVSYVAPMREISTLVGTLLGTQLLLEGHTLRRATAALGMMLGVIALALG